MAQDAEHRFCDERPIVRTEPAALAEKPMQHGVGRAIEFEHLLERLGRRLELMPVGGPHSSLISIRSTTCSPVGRPSRSKKRIFTGR